MAANPKLYRKLSEPFAGTEESNEALGAFFDGVAALREQHRITEVYMIASVNVLDGEGEEGAVITSAGFGDPMKREMLVAWALGTEQAERAERIARLAAGAAKKARGKS